ncbi:hypothetical protein [Adlercreutzia sp. ZJ304]|uniref:hypothetical protein n=1 Tax=Adlercreutzia sp. ZJ304 TaxID=2709791 RepID=UPI0013E9BBC5|nr:hypothetical protein [Adlercreutzia sp. ZJ304]
MKKIVSALFAAALVAGLPTLAFAAPSPANEGNENTVEDVEIKVSIPGQTADDKIYIEEATEVAEGTPEGVEPLANIEVTDNNGWTNGKSVTLSFDLSSKGKAEGNKVTVYIQHGNGTKDVQYVKVGANGMLNFTVKGLSTFTIVDGWPEGVTEADSTFNNVVKATLDKSDKSPKTGIDMSFVGGVGVAAAVSACGVAVLRKKVSE